MLRKNIHVLSSIHRHPQKQSRVQQSQSSFGKTDLKSKLVFSASTSHEQFPCVSHLNSAAPTARQKTQVFTVP